MQVIDVHGSPAVFTIKLLTVFEENFLYQTCGPECFILTFKRGVDAHLDLSWVLPSWNFIPWISCYKTIDFLLSDGCWNPRTTTLLSSFPLWLEK